MSRECPRSVRDTFLRTPSDTPSNTSRFRGHSRGHSGDTPGPKGPRDPCSRPAGLQILGGFQSWFGDTHLQAFIFHEVLQTPRPATEPRTPKPQKCILKSENAILDPPEKWPQKSIKMSKESSFGELKWL